MFVFRFLLLHSLTINSYRQSVAYEGVLLRQHAASKLFAHDEYLLKAIVQGAARVYSYHTRIHETPYTALQFVQSVAWECRRYTDGHLLILIGLWSAACSGSPVGV